jgi:hypothetical protein
MTSQLTSAEIIQYADMRFPRYLYADTDPNSECKGKCKQVEHNPNTDNWLIIGCLYCHYNQYKSCRATTRTGVKCRRRNALGSIGLCTRHQDWKDGDE